MKKTLAIIAMVVGAGSMNAQLTSKKGENYLPQSGDWSIGVDGNSAISFFGNMLNNSAANGMNYNYTTGNAQMITGKMFTSDNSAYRGALRIGMNSGTTAIPSLDSIGAFDDKKVSSSFIGLGLGLEKRRGSTRLQGYYGAMAMLTLQNGKSETTFIKPNQEGQITSTTDGATIGLGARAFIGVEYFVLPKISLAAEFGWGLMIRKDGEGSVTSLSRNSNGDLISTTVDTPGSSSFSIDTDNNNMGLAPAGNIVINFHF